MPRRGCVVGWRAPVCVALGLGAVSLAQAQTWFFVDPSGVLHYANEQVDAALPALFHEHAGAGDGPLFVDIRNAAAQLAVASEKDRHAATRYFASSVGYKLHAKHIRAAATKVGVDEQLLKAIATAELGFNASAVSPAGAIGLMQVIPDTAARFGVAGDPKRSIAQKLEDRPSMCPSARAMCAICKACSRAH